MGGWGRRSVAAAMLVVSCVLAGVLVVAQAAAAAPPPPSSACTSTWKLGGGLFNGVEFASAASWIEGVAPTASSTMCIVTGQVRVVSFSATIGEISVTDGAEFVIQGGTLNLTSTSSIAGVFLADGGVLDAKQDITIPEGRTAGTTDGNSGKIRTASGAVLTIDGTFLRRNGNSMDIDIDVINNGTFDMTGGGTVLLGDGRTFSNVGLWTGGPDATIGAATNGDARFHNTPTGTVSFVGGNQGPDAAGVRAPVRFDNDGLVRVVTGDVSLQTAGTGSGRWEVGRSGMAPCTGAVTADLDASAHLFFRPSPTTTLTGGSVTGSGCATIFGGTVAVAGTAAWGVAGTNISGGTLRSSGDRSLNQIRLANGGGIEANDGTVTMDGSISQTTPGQAVRFLGNGHLVVPAQFSVVHVGGNSFDVSGSLTMDVFGPLDVTASFLVRGSARFVSHGAWTLGPTSFLGAEAGAMVRNEGTLTVDAGTGDVPFAAATGLDNVGTLRLVRGRIDMRAPLQQLVGSSMTGGRIELADNTAWFFFPSVTTLNGQIRLEGNAHLDPGFHAPTTALDSLGAIGPSGRLELAGAQLDLRPGPVSTFVNNGRMQLGGASRFQVTNYVQGSNATFASELGSTGGAGRIIATTAALAGTLEVFPAGSGSFSDTVISAGTIMGAFASIVAADGGTVSAQQFGDRISVDYTTATATIPPIVTTLTASLREGTAVGGTQQQPHQIPVMVINPNPFVMATSWTGNSGSAVVGPAGTGDATVLAGSFSLIPGPNLVFVDLFTRPDSVVEDDETFQVVFAPGGPPLTVSILDDDDPPPVLTFGPTTQTESTGSFSLSITRNSAKAALSVSVDTVAGTATEGQDYEPLHTTVDFPVGVRTVTMAFGLLDDAIDEPDETFALSFANGAFLATITIIDNDAPPPPPEPTFAATLSSFGPYAEDAGTISLILRIDHTVDVPLTFQVSSLDGTAEANQDYTPFALVDVTIPAGATEAPPIRVSIIDDREAFEVDREFFAVYAERNGILLDVADVDIIDNDSFVQARFVRASTDPVHSPLLRNLVEGNTANTSLPLFVELSAPITEPITVLVSVDSADGNRGVDFDVSTNEIVFQPGDGPKPVSVTSVADTQLEPDMVILLAVTTEAGELIGRTDDGAEVTLVDDDQSLNLSSSLSTTVSEGVGTMTVTVTAGHAPGEFVTIPVTINGVTAEVLQSGAGNAVARGSHDIARAVGPASADVDARSVPDHITLGPADTSVSFTIPILADDVPEPDETFDVVFGRPNQGRFVESVRQVTIVDDDALPFDLSVGDVAVREGKVAFLDLVAVPTDTIADGFVELPVTVRDVTATLGEDYVTANGTTATIRIPAAGGHVPAFAIIVNDGVYDLPESFEVTFGRPGVAGEQTTARVFITNIDPPPTPTITTNSPYGEDAGTVSLNLRLDRAAGSPLAFHVVTRDGDAFAVQDYEAIDTTITIPKGHTEGPFIRLTIIDDAISLDHEPLHEVFVVSADRAGFATAEAVITILNNDVKAKARFVRDGPDPDATVVRTVAEGSSVALDVDIVGAQRPVTATVTIQVASAFANADDYTVTPTRLTFGPATPPQTVTITATGDSEPEPNELLVVALETRFDDPDLPDIDDTASVTIIDDDTTPPPPVDSVASFANGWTGVTQALSDWLRQFDLDAAHAPAVVTPALADHFGLGQQSVQPTLPTLNPLDSTLAELCADLLAKGFAVDFVAGGLCGRPAATGSEVIRARTTVTLADLADVAGFSADPYNDATNDVLRSLASSLGLDAQGGWVGDLTVTIVAGVDGGGFYIGSGTELLLDVGGAVDLAGAGNVAGAATTISGTAAADLHVRLAPPVAKSRDLVTALQPTVTGTASVDLAFAAGPLALGWTGAWTMTASAVTTGPQVLSGTLSVPGVTALAVVATLNGSTWHLTATGETGEQYRLAGFRVTALQFAADLGPSSLAGAGSMRLTAPTPGGDQQVDVDVTFDRTNMHVGGELTLPALGIGDPQLLRLVDAFVRVDFDASLPAGSMAGVVEVGAATAIVLPTDPVGTATGVLGTLSSTGALVLSAESMAALIADGAIEATLSNVSLTAGPNSGTNLLEVDSATGVFPALDDLAITMTGLFLTKAGVFGAASVAVASQGLAQSIGLGGVLPFDVNSVTVVFPNPANLDSFEVSVAGSFDFDAFPDAAGFTPRVGLGGPVVTPSSPPDQNRFVFSVDVDSLAEGVVRPLDVGPLTLGFDGLTAGDSIIGADITLGGFVDGVFQSDIGGSLTVDGPGGSLLDSATVTLDGTITPGTTTVADISGRVLLTGTLGPLRITDLDLAAGVRISFGPSGMTFEPRLEGFDVGAVEFPLGDFVTLRAEGVDIDLDPPAGGNILEVGATGGLTVHFDDAFPALAGWGGTFRNVAVGDDFVPKLLPNFGFDLDVPDDMNFGLPEFIPLTLGAIGITFPDVATTPAGGITLTPDLLAGLRVRVSGGLDATPTWPISAAVDGLEVDLGKLTRGEFPITNLDAVAMGVEPFELPGGVVIGGGLKLGTVDVDGTTVFYGRVFGDFAVADIGGGADLVVTQYGPVLMKVRAPLGIPLGPTGIVLAGAEGAAQFGDVSIPVPPVGDPVALLNAFTLPTDLTITEQVIIDAVRPAVAAGNYTWDEGFALSLAGDLIVAAAPGVLKGRATIGMNLGRPTGPSDPPGLQLVGKGEVTAFGIPLGQIGMLVDFTDPIEPSFDLAFASPVPGSPLALLFPARATFGVQLRTDGVVLGTIEGLRTFVQRITAGTLTTGADLFGAVIDVLAARLDANRSRPLTHLLLDLDGNGTIAASEAGRTIDRAFVLSRAVALLPSNPSGAAFDRAARVATALMNEVLLVTGDVLDHPERYGSFALPSTAGGSGFEGLVGAAGDALAAMAGVIRDATSAGLAAFGARFNPSFAMEGSLQATLLGLPLGSAVAGGELFIDRSGLFVEVQGSLVEMGQLAVGGIFPFAVPLIDAALTAATLGLTDEIQVGARLPFGGIVDALLGGSNLPTFQPLDPNWAVNFSGAIDVLGYEGAELSGIAFLPGQQTFLDSRIQKLFALPVGTPVDANRIPITSQAHYDALVQYGGMLLTASLRVPRLVTNPAAQLAAFPPPPANPVEYLAWLDQIAATATQTDTPARVQFFVPGISTITSEAQAVDWAESLYLEGVWDGRVLGLDLGRGTLNLTPAGLELTGQFPLAGLTGTATLNTALLSSGRELPGAGVDIQLDTASIAPTLARIGVPSVLVPPVNATGRVRAYTPGFDRNSTDPVLRNGGIEVAAQLGTPGIIGTTGFTFALTPRAGGYDVHGTAFAQQIGPIAGATITNATITVDVVGGAATVTLDGNATVLGAAATVHGVLASDLTGALTFTFASGRMSLAGVQIAGTAVLTLTRVAGELRGSLGVGGTATLPAWLATAANQSTIAVAACVDTNGNAEVAMSMPAMGFGPNRLVRVGRATGTVTLPPSAAACTLPAGAPAQSATGPLFRLRLASGVATAVLNGSLDFTGSGSSIAGLRISGSLNTATGTGNLAVAFTGGTMLLGGFSVAGSATVAIAPGTFSMTVTGSLTVAGLVTNAGVTGSADENGVTSLGVSVGSLNLSPLTVSNASLALVRNPAGGYRLSLGATVSFTGLGSMAVNGFLDSAGNGSLALAVTSLMIAGASVTNGAFAIARTGSAIALSASGRFALFGASLEVVQSSLSLTQAGGIGGSLTIRPIGGGTLSLGGWTIGGTLRLAFAGTTSRLALDNGTLGIPGWGSVGVTADISVPVANGSFFQLVLPGGGLRLGGSSSPFFATGTFRLSFANNVATLSAANPSLSWKDGTTTVATFAGPSVVIRSDGFVSASMTGFSVAIGGFAFTVPSLSLLIDAQGLNARLALGAGSVTIPGLPTLTTPAIDIGTASTFSRTLVASTMDLGIMTLHGSMIFERQQGVFRLRFEAPTGATRPFLEIENLVDVPLPSFSVASNGTFSIDATFPTVGPSGFQIVGGSMHLAKDGPNLTDLAGSITAGRLLVGTSEAIALPSLAFDADSRIDRTFTLTGWDIGPFLRTNSIELRVTQLSTGVMRLLLVGDATASAFANSTNIRVTDFDARSDGTLTGTVTGQLALFGTRLAQATFDVTKDGDRYRLTLPSSRRASLNLGFISASLSGFARTDGTFSFTGSTGVSLGVTGFSFSGSTSVNVSSTNGIEGDFSGRVCIVLCATTGGSLRSDGRIKGFLQIDLTGDGDFNDVGELNADWRVYLATGAVRVDINRDGDYDDLGDIAIGTTTSADETDPTMAQPPNITVNANIGTGGTVRVYYNVPIATDAGQTLTVRCTPPPGDTFGVGATTVTCTATDRAGNVRTRTFTVNVVASAAAAVPTANNGATVAVVGTGFLPGSIVFVRFQSDPVYVGVFTADADGIVRLDLTVPDSLPIGAHDVIIEGIGVNGGVWQYVQPIVVGGDEIGPPVDPAPAPAPTPLPGGALPVTGTDGGAGHLVPIGTLLIGIGVALVALGRRRRPAAADRCATPASNSTQTSQPSTSAR